MGRDHFLEKRDLVQLIRSHKISLALRSIEPTWRDSETPTHGSLGVRNRSILVNPSNGGEPCPHLQELDTCWEIELFNWQYGNWENCTLQDPQATCGPGNRTRNKTCVKLSGEFLEDYVCDHHKPSFVSETCRIPCPDDCVLSEWSDWSSCSLPCTGDEGEGEQRSNRTLLAIAGPDRPCLQRTERSDVCNSFSCTPAHWSPKEWGNCTLVEKRGNSSCGQGIQVREVLCMENGVVKPPKRCKNLNKPETLKKCPLPCPVDCVMTNFSDWSPCKANCDKDAIQYKQRFILQSPKHGGKPCPGALLEERLCTKALETICLRQRSASRPAYQWNTTTWSECRIAAKNRLCGIGFQVRNVSCVDDGDHQVEPQHCLLASGGAHLPSALRSCEITCSSGCVLTTWSAWSLCGYSHDSTRTRRRELVGSLSANEDCGSTFKLVEEEKCPAIPESLVLEEEGKSHWLSCIVEDSNATSVMVNGQVVKRDCGRGYRYKFNMEINAETGTGPGMFKAKFHL
ncbi:thrombospondin type-1 domain-containing protein 7B [Caerostris darwini]|uniref:Thrombospondin type-1 domain-containing protein 7B n=1 Tax=Caerostris darwini TaxID=1538125 RepID=A0AAV4TFB4_9ARAC|nr:thrombospondin type-1 domain-containing protein 7B [Caerostris darwini]